ncbi:MAG: hypothetical protein IKJ11_01400 [Clostridia bacterium]|nr:hypothetical protein [Clostridia bacterium]
MMRKTVLAALICVLICISGAAVAQTLPSNEVFSPGLKRLSELEEQCPPVQAQAQVSLDKAMYARDLSVLAAMLRGTTIEYARSGEAEMIALRRGGEELGAYALPSGGALDALEEKLLGAAVLERVPLAHVAQWLEGLQAGDALGFGFAVSRPFELERTMSDDGTRLTKIRVSGAIARAGETPCEISGYLRQPAGRTPKDTFELTFRQDEDNEIELLYSALRENEVTRKNKEGTVSVHTTIKAAGRIEGSSISSRLSVTMKNRWRADTETLGERITITATLGLTDRRPGRRMLRLNDASAEIRNVISLTTKAPDEAIEISDEITFDVTLDGQAFLAGSADVTLRAGGEPAAIPGDLQTMDKAAAKALASAVYRQLDKNTLDTIHQGL